MTRAVRVNVLGSCGGFPEPGRACSGFLVEADGAAALLDLGYGTLPRLLELRPAAEVDAIVITHEHPDHCLDLHPLFRIHRYGREAPHRLRLYCPNGVLERLSGIEPDVDLTDVFDVHPLPGTYDIGPFALTAMSLPHFVPNAGVRLETNHRVIAFTGDTGPVPALAELGQDADMFIVEATDRPGETGREARNLMTAEEAGYWADQARARRLVLTHFWPGTDRRASVHRAAQHYRGEIIAATEGMTLQL